MWQGRFKIFPLQQDGHLLTVLRYVLRNPVRAGLVEPARPHLTDVTLIPLPEVGTSWIDQPFVTHELTTLRTCVNRQQPFGAPEWQQQLATTLGLESTLRPRGRPAKFK